MIRVFSIVILILLGGAECFAIDPLRARESLSSQSQDLQGQGPNHIAVDRVDDGHTPDRSEFSLATPGHRQFSEPHQNLDDITQVDASSPRVAALEARTPATTVRIYYGTNRPVVGRPQGNHYGTCDVSIPARHQFGELERPSLWRLEFRESAAKHVMLRQVTPLAEDSCMSDLRRDLTQAQESEIFVFIHGYNVTFAEAAMRTAQMAYDLRYQGVPLMYSWPSRGEITGYGSDLRQADLAAESLADFLLKVSQESGARRIHLVAHSMGNRALVGALAHISELPSPPRYHQIVFAAPDLDAAQFVNHMAPRIQPVVERATIYSSGSDLALWASQLVHRTVRLGRTGDYLRAIGRFDWIDVIDTTSIGFEWLELGHSAYGSELLVDLRRVLDGQPMPHVTVRTGPETWTVGRPAIPAASRLAIPRQWPPAPIDRWK